MGITLVKHKNVEHQKARSVGTPNVLNSGGLDKCENLATAKETVASLQVMQETTHKSDPNDLINSNHFPYKIYSSESPSFDRDRTFYFDDVELQPKNVTPLQSPVLKLTKREKWMILGIVLLVILLIIFIALFAHANEARSKPIRVSEHRPSKAWITLASGKFFSL